GAGGGRVAFEDRQHALDHCACAAHHVGHPEHIHLVQPTRIEPVCELIVGGAAHDLAAGRRQPCVVDDTAQCAWGDDVVWGLRHIGHDPHPVGGRGGTGCGVDVPTVDAVVADRQPPR